MESNFFRKDLSLCAVFEKKRDSSTGCFKWIFDFLFGHDGSTNLQNVSDRRGYMIPAFVFTYLFMLGADVVGTVKRLAQCWSFTFNQKLKERNKRTFVYTKGAPTLFLKWYKVGAKYIFASAFRNGIILDNAELRRYNEDKSSLIPKFLIE